MQKIEQNLVSYHAEVKITNKAVEFVPFCRIGNVSPNSPAEQSGILSGDKIIHFGNLNSTNYNNLQTLARTTKENIEKQIKIELERVEDGKIKKVTINLIPSNNWGGTGLIGCSFNLL
ncbi:hypothetical protein BB559_003612 [Furculomyces boomerangus]|uniref:Probable 26S proteasome regulatory subunit p27 n=1 Tax=Furculomyces boomerangus TaxID=61424 RepID=A0A2T9YKB5_9FUNG|nr:hypothetical protein BB559_003612 [Furculomyces boomerangus]